MRIAATAMIVRCTLYEMMIKPSETEMELMVTGQQRTVPHHKLSTTPAIPEKVSLSACRQPDGLILGHSSMTSAARNIWIPRAGPFVYTEARVRSQLNKGCRYNFDKRYIVRHPRAIVLHLHAPSPEPHGLRLNTLCQAQYVHV